MTKLHNQPTRHSEFISESTRHCEQSEAISSRLPRPNGLAMTEQTGRSMVEMLGVLAVIGVLSITGISGYTTAMNKHRANEILDAASKRAVVVSTQLQSGRTNPTLAEFGDDNTVAGATFSTALETQGSDKFVIKFTSGNEPSAEIWTQMQNIAGTTGIVRAYESGRTGLVYNNDLTTDAKISDYNGDSENCPGKYCSGTGLCITAGTDCTCSGTRTEACKKCNTATGAYDLANTDLNNKQDQCESGQVCNNGACEAAATPYKKGILKAYHWKEGATSLYSDVTTPKADSEVCPNGYKWAGYNDVINLENSYIASIFSNSSICDNCSTETYLWLKDCPNSSYTGTDECGDESYSYAWLINYYGNVSADWIRAEYYNNFSGLYALCIKNS